MSPQEIRCAALIAAAGMQHAGAPRVHLGAEDIQMWEQRVLKTAERFAAWITKESTIPSTIESEDS